MWEEEEIVIRIYHMNLNSIGQKYISGELRYSLLGKKSWSSYIGADFGSHHSHLDIQTSVTPVPWYSSCPLLTFVNT